MTTSRVTVTCLAALLFVGAAGCSSDPAAAPEVTQERSAAGQESTGEPARIEETPQKSAEQPAEAVDEVDVAASPPCGNYEDTLAAVAQVPPAFEGVNWVVDYGGEGCNNLSWALLSVEGATASSPNHVVFLHGPEFLGTATDKPYGYTQVGGNLDSDTVSVIYRWLNPGDANAAPSGGPVTIRYQWTGAGVEMLDPLPPEMVAAYE